jgi:hypothetical protein
LRLEWRLIDELVVIEQSVLQCQPNGVPPVP